MDDKVQCSVCKRMVPNEEASFGPSASTMINFSFYRPVKHVYRCYICEKRLAEAFSNIIDRLGTKPKMEDTLDKHH